MVAGVEVTEEKREKLSLAKKGVPWSEERRSKMPVYEPVAETREIKKRKPLSEETKQKIAATKKNFEGYRKKRTREEDSDLPKNISYVRRKNAEGYYVQTIHGDRQFTRSDLTMEEKLEAAKAFLTSKLIEYDEKA